MIRIVGDRGETGQPGFAWKMVIKRVTLNNCVGLSDYQTNGHYQISNPNSKFLTLVR